MITVRTQKPFPNLRIGTFIRCDSSNLYNMWEKPNLIKNKVTGESIYKIQLFNDLMVSNGDYNSLVSIIFKVNGTKLLKLISENQDDSRVFVPIKYDKDDYEKSSSAIGLNTAETFYLKISLKSLFDFICELDYLKLEEERDEFLREMNFITKAQIWEDNYFTKWFDDYKVNWTPRVFSEGNFFLPLYMVEHFYNLHIDIKFDTSNICNLNFDNQVQTSIQESNYLKYLEKANHICPANTSEKVAEYLSNYFDYSYPICYKSKCPYYDIQETINKKYNITCPVYNNNLNLAKTIASKEPLKKNILIANYLENYNE